MGTTLISPQVAAALSVCGSAALAFWLVAVHRRFGPQSLRSALLACAVSFVLLAVVQQSLSAAVGATDAAVVLLAVVVPSFGFAFWTGGVLIRAFVAGPASIGRGKR